jgi:hypothetical protein
MKRLSIIAIAASVLFANCTKDPSENLNKDPKAASSATAAGLFLDGELSFVNSYNTTSVAVAPFRVVSQEWVENTYTYESNYNFSAYNAPGGFWQNLYVNTIQNLDQAKLNFPVGWPGTAGQLRNCIDICDLLEIYSYYMLVGTYGNIPYTQAEQTSIPFPKYDDAATIYADLLTRVDTCIAGLDITQGAMGSADQIYQGSTPAWLKFAASLKLKMAMLNAAHDPSTTATKVNEAIATGVFGSNADNALFTYDPASPTNSNPIWNALFYSGRHDFGPSQFLVDTMLSWSDPRLPFYFTESGDTAYIGAPPGDPSDAYGSYSDFCCIVGNQLLYSASLPGDILDYSEIEFYKAEAAAQLMITGGATAAALYYDSAITASITSWGGSAGSAAAYLLEPQVNYTTALAAANNNWQTVIGYQEWIANFNKNWDSWTAIRRLGQPNINVVSPPQSPASLFPLRFYYPPNETTSNPTNTAAAVAALPGGQDVVTAKLFWEP